MNKRSKSQEIICLSYPMCILYIVNKHAFFAELHNGLTVRNVLLVGPIWLWLCPVQFCWRSNNISAEDYIV